MTMARWQSTIVDDTGDVLPAASVEVREEIGGAPLAVIYSDRDGLVSIGNPFSADGDGFAAFHVLGGAYRITVTSGAFSRVYRYVAIGTAAETDTDAYTPFQFIATGTTSFRTAAEHAGDLFSLKDFGAVGDGGSPLTDDTAAVTTADATDGAKFVPEGIYDTTISQGAFTGPYWGRGQIRDSGDNLRAPWFSAIGAAPATLGNQDSILTAFNGDLSGVQIAMEHRITGAATSGQPVTGYDVHPEVSPVFIYAFNQSGHNQATASNDGRTGMAMLQLHFNHSGQGDFGAIYFSGVISAAKAGATSFLASPGSQGIYGQLFAGAVGAYMNPIEINCNDNGIQSAAVGYVPNFNRTVATATLGEVWMGVRPQNSGSQNSDVIYSGAGGWKRGLDFTAVTFAADKSAINLKADDRIYGNSTSSGTVPWAQTLGDDYFLFNATRGWEFFVDGVSAVRMSPGGVFAVRSEDAGAGGGPFFGINRVSASPAAADTLGFLVFNGQDSGGNETAYAFLAASIIDPTNGSEDGQLALTTQVGGAGVQQMGWANGITIGSPTGGFQGSGTLNMDNAVFRDGTQVVAARQTGWNAPTGTLTRGTFDAGATLAVTAQTLAALLTDLRTHGLIGT